MQYQRINLWRFYKDVKDVTPKKIEFKFFMAHGPTVGCEFPIYDKVGEDYLVYDQTEPVTEILPGGFFLTKNNRYKIELL